MTYNVFSGTLNPTQSIKLGPVNYFLGVVCSHMNTRFVSTRSCVSYPSRPGTSTLLSRKSFGFVSTAVTVDSEMECTRHLMGSLFFIALTSLIGFQGVHLAGKTPVPLISKGSFLEQLEKGK